MIIQSIPHSVLFSFASLWSYQEDHFGESIHIAGYWVLMCLVSFLCISTEPVKINAFTLLEDFQNPILSE